IAQTLPAWTSTVKPRRSRRSSGAFRGSPRSTARWVRSGPAGRGRARRGRGGRRRTRARPAARAAGSGQGKHRRRRTGSGRRPPASAGVVGLRLGLPRAYFLDTADPDVEAAVLAAAAVLEGAGRAARGGRAPGGGGAPRADAADRAVRGLRDPPALGRRP